MSTIKFEKGATSVIAHRGLSGIETENTLAAFIAAGNRSYFGIETDIRRTDDGHFVVCHDATLSRIAGEGVSIEECTLATIQSVVLFDKDGTKGRTDLRICTLENYIDICKRYGKHCVLELKSDFTDEETARFIAIIRERGYLDEVTFISFVYENLLKVRALLPEQSVQFLFAHMTEENIEKARSAHMDVDVHFLALTKENVAALHEAGCKVNAWTVDDPEIGAQLAAWGVDFITSNILE